MRMMAKTTPAMRRLIFLPLLLVWSTVFCKSYVIQPGVWRYKNHPIAYEQSTTATSSAPAKTPILVLNGFGVGSFHQHRLIQALMEEGDSSNDNDECFRPIFGIDYLGQGASWPQDCNDGDGESEQGLRYCGNTWVDQIIHFIEEVIVSQGYDKVHIVGNSVGGHLAAFVAAQRPDLVESLCLLNPTPVWGLNLPGWNGHLPAPALPKLIGRYLFDRIRDLRTIEKYLENAYANHAAFDDTLMQQIRDCTQGRGGHAAFASILWSPPVTAVVNGVKCNFYDCLSSLDCDVLLLFGAHDPWCKPAFAKRMLKALSMRTSDTRGVHLYQRYVELDSVGHCPNHEAPTAVARVLTKWLPEGDRGQRTLVEGSPTIIQEAWGNITVRERTEPEIPMSIMDRLAVAFV